MEVHTHTHVPIAGGVAHSGLLDRLSLSLVEWRVSFIRFYDVPCCAPAHRLIDSTGKFRTRSSARFGGLARPLVKARRGGRSALRLHNALNPFNALPLIPISYWPLSARGKTSTRCEVSTRCP